MANFSLRGLEDELRKEYYSGLAIIVTNNYRNSGTVGWLKGTFKDGGKQNAAFSRMNFYVRHFSNVDLTTFQSIVDQLSQLKWDIVKEYSCIAILFAGHGLRGDELVFQDDQSFKLSTMVNPLLPGSNPHLGDVPKVFS